MNNIYLNGLKTYCFSSKGELIDFAFRERKSLIAINAEKILHSSEQTRYFVENNIGFSDGIGAVWAIRRKGFNEVVKIPGCELWLDIIKASFHEKTFYLIGSTQEIIETTVKKLRKEFPGISILNFRNGYFKTDNEKRKLLDDIAEKKPDVVFVAMGSPRQEIIINEMSGIHPAVYQGLGGSFDVFSGFIQRAPEWWLRNNLEWAYRLIKQPSRLTRQIYLARFMWLLVTGKI